MLKLILSIYLSIFLISCNKPDPNPELKDPIYLDLVAATATANQQIENEKKTLEGNRKELKEVALQTGQNLYAEKRVRESIERIQKLEQEKLYLDLKVQAQKKLAKSSYLQAFKKGEPWPNEKDWDSYQNEKKLRSVNKSWNAKSRISDFKQKNNKNGPVVVPEGHH
ncbi:MAG: hypothetical protein ACXVCP_01045 [Bdellovibrio sp.]